VISSGMYAADALTLFVDIGTNGEIVLGNKDWLIACACSAGPAFEGGGVTHGCEQLRRHRGRLDQRRDPGAVVSHRQRRSAEGLCAAPDRPSRELLATACSTSLAASTASSRR